MTTSMSYGAVEDDVMADMKQYYRDPQTPQQQSKSKFGRGSSYSSNAASFEYLEMDASQQYKDDGQQMYSPEFDLDIAAEPRDIYKANHIPINQKASHNLKCLWISILLLFIFTLSAA
eukprot:761270_1